ncbi:efflux RND transporter periplasmic adaptor subunit [Desulfococcus multivorans]|uniref:Efflux transporter, RND family, MFP subunit n=1 Tax=Desulfococcus multivorans DSM 2059 TaxID=1121405 RepID=S7V9F2_DESML|nr:efflux RND transporter periplasmic adaptor subunit [Desulfococcus multivorans]AOY58530.1 TtgA: toluene efflux pump periplasmic linker protein [Desulfococcus multivorans]AQX36460.1 efflux transporter periplasmic adaptor subunit [Desulfococcus multivorans]EPR43314.1 efflux transporter, RND family, MFP subunit [Desulfococcus multivorans DSM 2059]SJZ42593.1 membrane fusion protein, multidrug efflux system [Desulfococcus multivorans DSM 2059]
MQLNKNGYEPSAWTRTLTVLSALFLLWGCGKGYGEQQAAPPPPPEVVTVTVTPRKIELTTELPGRTSAYRVAEIRPQVNGIIQKRQFREGSDVKAGQLLYQIDPAPFQVALDSARASLGKAQANLPSIRSRVERYTELLVDKAISRQDYDDAVSAVDQAKAEIEYWKTQVAAARINLGYAQVNAPISGRIGRSNVTDGALVTAYQPLALATIQQLDPIYVDVTQSSAELLRLKRNLETGRLSADRENGKAVRIVMEDGSPYPLEGKLQFREVTVDPATGSYTVRIVVPNPEHLLLPGMFVRALVQEGIAEAAILVPQQGVSRNPKGEAVALIVDDVETVRQRILILNRAIGDQWLVASGLSAGDRLIIEGMMNVRPGSVVKAISRDALTVDGDPPHANRPSGEK